MRNRWPLLFLSCLLQWHGFWATPAHGQFLTSLFPEGVPGYGDAARVTVQSRQRPLYEPLGIRLDTVMIRPLLSLSTGYDDNIFAGPKRRGSWEFATRPSVLIGAERSQGAFGLYLSADDIRYANQPSQNRTDGGGFIGTTMNVGRDRLTIGGGVLSRHQDRTELDALPSDKPVGFRVGNLRAAYDHEVGRTTVTPAVDLNLWRFDNTTIQRLAVSQATRDRTTAQGGLTLRHAWMPARELVIVTRLLETHYDHPAARLPSNNSTSLQVLGGIDYDDNTVWRYRLLAGAQHRAAASSAFASQTVGVVESAVTWSPSGMTTIRAGLSRGIEDAAQTGFSSFTFTSGTLTLDHELFRNILLNASATARWAVFNQSGAQQTGLAVGLGSTWLIDRNFRLSVSYDVTDVRSSHLPVAAVAGNYIRDLALLTLRIGL